MSEAIETSAAVTALQAGKDAVAETKHFFHIDEIRQYISVETAVKAGVTLVTLLVFYVIYRLIRRLITRSAAKRFSKATASALSKGVSYTFYVLIVMYIFSLFGIKLSAVWGAAGIAGVAIGFAAQTSVSNLISGLFVLTEKAIKPGDFIEIDGVSGTVDTISILSVRIHTLDNQFVRIPNSQIINNKLKNFSTFDLRRHVFELSVDYASDLDKTLEALSAVAGLCPTVITDNPDYAPKVLLTGLSDSGINVNIIVWFKRADFAQTRTDLCRAVIQVCREAGINIPFNRMDVTLLSADTKPAASVL